MGGGGGKSGGGASVAPAPVAEAPQPEVQEQAMDDAAQSARDEQLKRAKAALGQEGSVLTSPFGAQQNAKSGQAQQGKTILGG